MLGPIVNRPPDPAASASTCLTSRDGTSIGTDRRPSHSPVHTNGQSLGRRLREPARSFSLHSGSHLPGLSWPR